MSSNELKEVLTKPGISMVPITSSSSETQDNEKNELDSEDKGIPGGSEKYSHALLDINRPSCIVTRGTMLPLSSDEISFTKCLFSLIILAVGTSSFAMPYWIQYTGIVFGIILIILGAILNLWSYYLLKPLFLKYNINTYEGLVVKIYGIKMSIFLSITLIIFELGILIIYHVLIYKLLGGIINLIGKYGYESLNDFLKKSFWKKLKYKAIVNYGLTVVIFIPLSIMKSSKILTYTSMLGVISFFLLLLIIICQFPFYFKDYLKNIYVKSEKSTHLNIYDISKGFGSDLLAIQAIVTFIFNYTYHFGLIPIISKLKERNEKSLTKMLNISTLILCITFLLLSITGYLTEPISTPDLIIERRVLFGNDEIMMVGWITLILTGLTKIPLNYYNLRISFFTLFNIPIEQVSNVANIVFTIVILVVTTLVGTLYQNVIDYFSLLGSFCNMFFAMLIPALLYAKGMDYPRYHWINIFNVTLAVVVTIIGLVSGVYTIIGMVKG